MSGRVTNIEIEDVLSSIRRLVSSEEREPRAETADMVQEQTQVDKLVLTPAQRVDPEDVSVGDDALIPGLDGELLDAEAVANTVDETTSEVDGTATDDPSKNPIQEFRTGRRLEARIAEVEAVVAQQEGEWEPDGASEDAYAGNLISPLPWVMDADAAADHVEIVEDVKPSTQSKGESIDSLEQPVIDDDAESDEFSWLLEDAKIDEAALRDIVTEIVRQELQGALGERITRNVRKLVRREIQRALLAHRLD
ncbi:hypothetical protein [Roseovarius sp. EL26]|uniref:hypothetical protein n=1 Tax=Roseovarius sp. EL26 TaxID=2126672 RepID=UPI000EA306AD|nr:hypothetical protein [Roseovarius sp. EL26]